MNLGEMIDEGQVLPLLRRESGLRRRSNRPDRRWGSVIRVLVEETTELITHRIKEASHLAVIAVVGLSGHTAEQVVDIVQGQFHSDS